MKKSVILLILIITAASCSLFEKPSMSQEEIDALVAEKAAVDEQLANLQQQFDLLKLKADECATLLEEQTQQTEALASAARRYFVITGAFKNNSYANEYSEEMKKSGGIGEVIQGPYHFNLVAFSAHSSLREAIQAMYKARETIVFDAWVYTKR